MDSLTREAKEQRWQEMAAWVEKITDGLGMPVDSGIKETVIVLNLLGFPTAMSCEGHADRGVSGPWVDMKSKDLEALEEQWQQAILTAQAAHEEKRPLPEGHYKTLRAAKKKLDTPVLHLASGLMAYLITFYAARVAPHNLRLVLKEYVAGFRLECHGTFLQEVVEPPQREAKLREYQDEMRAFTAFLKERYFAV